jgi:hypothetical protein
VKILKFWRTELSYAQNKNRGEKVRLLGMDTCPSLNDIRILRFSHIYCQIFRIVPFVDGSRYKINGPLRPLNSECITSTVGSEKFQTFLRILFWRNILKSWPSVHRYSYMVKYLIKFVVINRQWEKLIYLWTGSFFFSRSWFQNIAPK